MPAGRLRQRPAVHGWRCGLMGLVVLDGCPPWGAAGGRAHAMALRHGQGGRSGRLCVCTCEAYMLALVLHVHGPIGCQISTAVTPPPTQSLLRRLVWISGVCSVAASQSQALGYIACVPVRATCSTVTKRGGTNQACSCACIAASRSLQTLPVSREGGAGRGGWLHAPQSGTPGWGYVQGHAGTWHHTPAGCALWLASRPNCCADRMLLLSSNCGAALQKAPAATNMLYGIAFFI